MLITTACTPYKIDGGHEVTHSQSSCIYRQHIYETKETQQSPTYSRSPNINALLPKIKQKWKSWLYTETLSPPAQAELDTAPDSTHTKTCFDAHVWREGSGTVTIHSGYFQDFLAFISLTLQLNYPSQVFNVTSLNTNGSAKVQSSAFLSILWKRDKYFRRQGLLKLYLCFPLLTSQVR